MVRSDFSSDRTDKLDLVHPNRIYSAFVGLVNEIVFINSAMAPSGEIMSEPSRSMTREAHPSEDIGLSQPDVETMRAETHEIEMSRARSVAAQRLVWANRRFILQATAAGVLLSTLIAFLIPKRFQTTTRLMPPDQGSSGMGMAMMAAASGSIGSQVGSSLGSMAGDLLGLKNSSDLFIGILQSRTVLDDVINKFDLKKVYSDRQMVDAREDLQKFTSVSADRKS